MTVVIAIERLPDAPNQYERSRFDVSCLVLISDSRDHRHQSLLGTTE